MKLRYKLFLIITLFFGILIFYNHYSYCAVQAETINDLPEIVTSNQDCLSFFGNAKGYFFAFSYKGSISGKKYIVVCMSTYSDHAFAVEPYQSSVYIGHGIKKAGDYDDSTTLKNFYWYYRYSINDDGSFSLTDKTKAGRLELRNFTDLSSISVLHYTNFSCPLLFHEVIAGTKTIYELFDVTAFVDKINLFELNLTDKNFNNTKHTFTLNTTEEDSYYEELTNLINSNNNYCIYLTDYTRLLTYENPNLSAPLVSGSYLLSGYIDFLVSENAYFYYSPHYNRIKVSAGNYFNDVVTDRGKRFFFTLVYSDDSDNTYFTIHEDNGSLWALSDTTGGWNEGNSISDNLEDIKNSYFIGSNQTIYYAKEDNNYILDGLTDSIYYTGCSNSAYYKKYSASHSIKTRGEDKYIYNFSFSGGGVKYFYLNKDTFNDDISNTNNFLTDKKNNPNIITDTSEGKSNLIPTDNTTYTYIYNYNTNETDPEEDEKHVETNRNPYISDKETDDTSGWSIWDFLKGIFSAIGNIISALGNLVSDLINGIISLLVPSGDFFSNLFGDINDWFSLKLGFIFYPFQLIADVLGRIATIEYTNPILNIPDIKEPLTGNILFHAITFNFNDLLEQHESFKLMHNIYLTIVDVIIIFGLVNLLRKKFEEVTTK